MGAADLMIEQGPVLPDHLFESTDELYDDFSDFGQPGFFQDPRVDKHNTGRWDDNMLFDDFGLSWVSPDYGITINNERVKYVNQNRPHPDGWSPFQKIDGKFTLVNHEVDPTNEAERLFARQKDYHLLSLTPEQSKALYNSNHVSSRIAVLSDFVPGAAEATGDPGLEPLDQSKRLGTHSIFGPYQVELDGKVLFNYYPMRWLGGMMTTRNRWGMKMNELCRLEARMRMPQGSRVGSLTDFNKMENCFSAWWVLQMLYFNKDVNGEPHIFGPTQSFMPFTNSGRLNECDMLEHLGHDPNTTLHTIHHHNNLETGEPLSYMDYVPRYVQHRNLPNSIHSAENLAFDSTSEFHTYRCDFTTDKIGFAVNGRYMAVLPMPQDWINPLPMYQTKNDQGYSAVRNSGGFGVHNGEIQRNTDGTPRYMEMMMIFNNAMNGKFTIAQMYRQINDRANFAQFNGDPHMQIEYVRAVRLKEGNLKDYDDNGTPQFTGYDIVANRANGGHCLVARARK